MKHSYRNRIIFAVLAVGTIMTAMHAVTEKDNATADTTSISTDSPTMGSLQKDLIAYLMKSILKLDLAAKNTWRMLQMSVCMIMQILNLQSCQIIMTFNSIAQNICINWTNSKLKGYYLFLALNLQRNFCQKP